MDVKGTDRAHIDILCRVVDNYGDIGVAWRLARDLSGKPEAPRLRLVVDNLEAFAAVTPEIDPSASIQSLGSMVIADWAGNDPRAVDVFREEPPRIVIECFACGRPDWYEDILFDGANRLLRFIVNLEYLTAEDWAPEFHRLPSLTRSPLVKKALFMPGMKVGTGGLIQDQPFLSSLQQEKAFFRENLARDIDCIADCDMASRFIPKTSDPFIITVFSYERDFTSLVEGISAFAKARDVLVLVAAGKSGTPFVEAWRLAGSSFRIVELPFLPQETWDRCLVASDFSIVRGEDSLSRAVLAGKPFLWQAYPQDGRHHMVKVRALLDSLRPHFPPTLFSIYENLFIAFNDRDRDDISERGGEDIFPALLSAEEAASSFRAFALSVRDLGDLGDNLMAFVEESWKAFQR